MLEDRTGKLTIDQVSQPPITDHFHSNTVPTEGVYTYWFRYRFRNIMTRKAEIVIPEWLVSYADVYTQNAIGGWGHKMSGRYVPWNRRDGIKKFMSILYTLQPGEELLIYERNEWATPHSLPKNFDRSIYFVNKTTLEGYLDYEPSVLAPFIFGVFLVAAFLNFYFFIVIRERVYLYFSSCCGI